MEYIATMDFNHPDTIHQKHIKGHVYEYKENDEMTKKLVKCGYIKPFEVKTESVELVKELKEEKETKELKVSKRTKKNGKN